jgi:hypothetical protein
VAHLTQETKLAHLAQETRWRTSRKKQIVELNASDAECAVIRRMKQKR